MDLRVRVLADVGSWHLNIEGNTARTQAQTGLSSSYSSLVQARSSKHAVYARGAHEHANRSPKSRCANTQQARTRAGFRTRGNARAKAYI
eukprot:6196140-Pleurochrysis_carterae.AAC.2